MRKPLLALLMAISFIGGNSASASPNTDTSVDISGLGVQAGDLILAAGAVGDTADNGLAAPLEGGYTRLPPFTASFYSNDSNDVNLDVYYKIADGTETAVTFDAVGGNNASNAAIVMVFRGVDNTTPFDTDAVATTGINSSNANPPSLDWSGAAGVWTVAVGATGHTGGATASFTFPTGYTTNAISQAHNDSIDVLIGMGYNTSPSDPEDPGVFTASNIGTAASNAWAAVTIALNPSTSTTHEVSVSESVALSESPSATATFSVSATESVALSESPSAVAAFSDSISESMALAESQTGGLLFVANISESMALSESQTGGLLLTGEVTESIALVDAQSSQANFAPSMSESLALSEDQTGGLLFTGEVTESVALAESQTGGLLFNVSVVETLNPTEEAGGGERIHTRGIVDFNWGPK